MARGLDPVCIGKIQILFFWVLNLVFSYIYCIVRENLDLIQITQKL
jgi:uncharacterized membrane protein YagU involved in acid resistance